VRDIPFAKYSFIIYIDKYGPDPQIFLHRIRKRIDKTEGRRTLDGLAGKYMQTLLMFYE